MRPVRLTAVLLLTALFLLTGCSGFTGAPDASREASGRFLEQDITPPELAGRPAWYYGIQVHDDGSADCFVTLLDNHRGLDEPLHFHASDGVTWEQQDTGWLTSIRAQYPDSTFIHIMMDEDRTIYFLFDYDQGVNPPLYWGRSPDGDSIEPLPLPQQTSYRWMGLLPGGSVAALDSEFIQVFRPDSGEMILEVWEDDPIYPYTTAFFQDRLVYLSPSTGSLNAVSLPDGQPLDRYHLPLTEGAGSGYYAAPGEDGALYLLSDAGIQRLPRGGSILETVIDGSVLEATIEESIPGLSAPLFRYNPVRGLFYLTSQSSSRLLCYRFDPEAPAMPQNELRVYSLYRNEYMWNAAAAFRAAHPEIQVRYTVGVGNGIPDTPEEAIQKLEAGLMDGSGPHVLLLDGLPAQRYRSEGLLEDLSTLPLEWTESLPSTVGSYGIPLCYATPMLALSSQVEIRAGNMAQLADTVLEAVRQDVDHGIRDTMDLFRLLYPLLLVEHRLGQEDAPGEYLELVEELYRQCGAQDVPWSQEYGQYFLSADTGRSVGPVIWEGMAHASALRREWSRSDTGIEARIPGGIYYPLTVAAVPSGQPVHSSAVSFLLFLMDHCTRHESGPWFSAAAAGSYGITGMDYPRLEHLQIPVSSDVLTSQAVYLHTLDFLRQDLTRAEAAERIRRELDRMQGSSGTSSEQVQS